MIAGLLFAAGLVLVVPAALALTDPLREIDEPVFLPRVAEVGTIAAGESLTATLTLYNGLADEVRLVKVLPNCGCTVAEIAEPVPPIGSGERFEIPIVFDSAGYSGEVLRDVVVEVVDSRGQSWGTVGSFRTQVVPPAASASVDPATIPQPTLAAPP